MQISYSIVLRLFLDFNTRVNWGQGKVKIWSALTKIYLQPIIRSLIKRVAGPFKTPPFVSLQVSPLSLVPKKDGDIRIFNHLSYPLGHFINFLFPGHVWFITEALTRQQILQPLLEQVHFWTSQPLNMLFAPYFLQILTCWLSNFKENAISTNWYLTDLQASAHIGEYLHQSYSN